ncbi:MAG: type II toxin-antitoxin system HicB family antitoxin [Verrucomicrobiota bacterium]
MTINAIIHKAEEGGYWAEVPSLPGCLTEGETMDEIQANLREAIQGWMEAAEERAQRSLDSSSSILALAV